MAKKIVSKTIEGSVAKYNNSTDIDFYDEREDLISWIDSVNRIFPEILDCYDTQHVKVTIIVEYDDGDTVNNNN